MERDSVCLSFHNGKREKVTKQTPVGSDEAQDALNTIEHMNAAGRKRGTAPRWYSIGIALVVAAGFALYAKQDPGDLPGLFIALGVALIAFYSRDKVGATARVMPDTRAAMWGLIGVSLFLVTLFFGAIYLRRLYDMAWIPVVAGLIAGTVIISIGEIERRGNDSND